MQITRRTLMRMVIPAAGLAVIPGRELKSETEVLKARRKAAQRRRRLILDDDGDLVYDDETIEGADRFCVLRLKQCADLPVDSIAWCIMWGIAKKGRTPTRYWQTQMQSRAFQENMPDPTRVVEKFCRGQRIEVFGSIRMNDMHDALGLPFGKLDYPLKIKHPEFLLGDESQRGGVADGLAAATWSGLNYAHGGVREDRFWWIEHTAASYGLDGVDLNFFRMPLYFKVGEEARHLHLITDLIHRSRRRLDEIGRQRGRPVLLGVVVPDTLEGCLRIGLDVETWLKEKLIDRLLVGLGYAVYSMPAEQMVALGHRYEVPVYPCINCPATYTLGNNSLRGAASNLWFAEADGLYLWNFHYINTPNHQGYGRPGPEDYRSILPEIADPKRLARLDKSFAASTKVWEQYARVSTPAPLPLSLGKRSGEKTLTVPVRIGDDIPTATRTGVLREIVLNVMTSGTVAGDRLQIRFNNSAQDLIVQDGNTWAQMRLTPETVKQGVNELQLSIAERGTAATKEVVVEQSRVDVRYRNSRCD